MKKTYQSKIEEQIYAGYRLVEINGTLKKLSLFSIIFSPCLAILVYFIWSNNTVHSLIAAVMVGIFSLLFLLLTMKRFLRKSLRKMLLKARGTDQPVESEYELADDGLVYRTLGQEVKFSWDTVVSIEETEDYIEVIFQPLGIAVIPKRIFTDPKEKDEWLNFIKDKSNSKLQT